MATPADFKQAADDIKAKLAKLEARVDKLIADAQNPGNTDVTVSDDALAELKGIAADADTFHAPVAVISTPPTP